MKAVKCHCWPDKLNPSQRCKNEGVHKMGSVKLCEGCYDFIEKLDPGFAKEYGKRKLSESVKKSLRRK